MLGPRRLPFPALWRSALQPCVGRAGMAHSSVRRTFSFRFPLKLLQWRRSSPHVTRTEVWVSGVHH